jgi:hypothetical protein
VALLALVTLFVAVARARPRELGAAATGSLFAGLGLAVASFAAFGEVSLGGAPAFNRFASPVGYALSLFDPAQAVETAAILQAAIGFGLIFMLIFRWWKSPASDALFWLPLAALAALPAIYPHYVCWVAAVAAPCGRSRFVFVASVATFIAPFWYVAKLNLVAPPQPSAAAYAVALAVTWGATLCALLLALAGKGFKDAVALGPHGLATPASR